MHPTDPSRPAPFISVIIPTYNRAKILVKSIQSVLGQTFKDFELIVVDDGSTDDTCATLEREFGSRIRLLRQPNQGVSEARNHGAREARGLWLAFNDSDDQWLPDKLERQIRFLENHPATELLCANGLDPSSGTPPGRPLVSPARARRLAMEGGATMAEMIDNVFIRMSTLMIRKALFLELGGFNRALAISEDADFMLRAMLHHQTVFMNEPLYLLGREGSHLGEDTERRCHFLLLSIDALITNHPEAVDRIGRDLLNRRLAYRYYKLGRACLDRAKIDEAQSAFKKSLSLDPFYLRPRLALWQTGSLIRAAYSLIRQTP